MVGRGWLLLLQEWEADGRIWGRFAAGLAARFEVRAVDGPAAVMGRAYRHALGEVVRRSMVGRPAARLAVGHGVAGCTAVDMAAEGLAEAVLVVSPGTGELLPDQAEELLTSSELWARVGPLLRYGAAMARGELAEAQLREMVEALTADLPGRLDPAEIDLVREVLHDRLPQCAACPTDVDDGLRPWLEVAADLGDRLTLVVHGAQRESEAAALAGRLPAARVLQLATATAYPWLEDTPAVLAAVEAALGPAPASDG